MNICLNSLSAPLWCENKRCINLKNYGIYSNLAPLTKDTVSFGSMKKNQFSDTDLLIIQNKKYNVQLSKFNVDEQFQNWCKNKIKEKAYAKNSSEYRVYQGRHEQTTNERTERLQKWFDFCLKENNQYTNAERLLIIDGITSKLRTNNDNLPPKLNKEILRHTMLLIKEIAENNSEIDFNKIYMEQSKIYALNDLSDDNGMKLDYTGWIVVPSKEKDYENFEKNVNYLQVLSHHNWCTKSFNADIYLSQGDFHIYLENGNPKLGIRYTKDRMQEVQGENNDGRIPVKYVDTLKEYIKNEKPNIHIKNLIRNAENAKLKVEDFKNKLGKPVNEATAEEIFKTANMFEKRDENDNLIILNSYSQPDYEFSWEDAGINEDDLFKEVKEINGNADFQFSKAKTLGNLKRINGNTDFHYSSIENLGELLEITGSADFGGSRIKTLGKLKEIGENAVFSDSIVQDLGNLEKIGKDAYYSYSKLTNLGKLKEIGGNAYFNNSSVLDTGDLETIGGDANLSLSEIKSLKNIKSIAGTLNLKYSDLKDPGNLKYVSKILNLEYSDIPPEMFEEKGLL